MNYIKSVVNSKKKSSCHVSRGPLCLNTAVDSMSLDLAKAFVAYQNMTQSTQYMYNPECVRKIYNSVYWSAMDKISADTDSDDKFGLYLFLGIAIGAVFVIAILLLVIYFKRRNNGEDESEDSTTKKLTGP